MELPTDQIADIARATAFRTLPFEDKLSWTVIGILAGPLAERRVYRSRLALERTAIHEAGHAAICMVPGRIVVQASIVSGVDAAGYMIDGSVTLAPGDPLTAVPISERFQGVRAHDLRLAVASSRWLLPDVGYTWQRHRELLRTLERRAERLLDQYWGFVEVVASLLLTCSTLSTQRLEDAFADYASLQAGLVLGHDQCEALPADPTNANRASRPGIAA
jgi:hypothetical protein